MKVMVAGPADFPWIAARTGCALTPNANGVKAVDAQGTTRGMVVYDGWTANSCAAHMAVDAPIAWRALLLPAFSYPFEQLGVGVILATVPGNNAKSLRLTKHLGFHEVGCLRDAHAAGVPLVVFEMRKENCGWLGRERKAA